MAANVSFASFNLYNFQAPGKKVYGDTISTESYNKKLHWTRDMLQEMDADIIGFQELWSKECLDDVLSTSELSSYQPIYLGDEWNNIAVALAIREPWKVEDVEIIKSFPFEQLIKVDDFDGEDDELNLSIKRFSRSVIKVRLSHTASGNTPDITVFACHLKSKVPSRVAGFDSQYTKPVGSALSTIRRTAEALALRMLLIDHLSGSNSPTVVIGDMNDDPLSNTLSLITDQPNMSSKATGGDKSLYSCLHQQLLRSYGDVYYTHQYKNHLSALDHILVSEEFFAQSHDAIWKHEETVFWNDHLNGHHSYKTDHGIIKAMFR
ncbi:endonuclease/exonuclease/phosphatase family protein [Vibrio sp. SCSIO 43169]|uniref:endonuclease/exonuclease/phosphatase family protein n=1 Tax=Vibrio sp. SCSIO 43169 TaxID=2822801 RepID=UPI0020449671|nr:endonuclease/exonuclease/phosphatase family protein [Vibrio sp. SCSIO 43169]MCM5506717.1 endonuclease/exonuclease/phosphatase family protein [Vibrio sp. SCSIO 43169]